MESLLHERMMRHIVSERARIRSELKPPTVTPWSVRTITCNCSLAHVYTLVELNAAFATFQSDHTIENDVFRMVRIKSAKKVNESQFDLIDFEANTTTRVVGKTHGNQVSFTVRYRDPARNQDSYRNMSGKPRTFNIKVFSNGKVTIVGGKHDAEIAEVTRFVLQYIGNGDTYTEMRRSAMFVKFNIDMCIDQKAFTRIMREKYNVICDFNSGYAAVCVKFMMNARADGVCRCRSVSGRDTSRTYIKTLMSWCTCTLVSIFVFPRGSVSYANCKSDDDATLVHRFLKSVVLDNFREIHMADTRALMKTFVDRKIQS